jgi:hypothetical protein
VAQEEVVDWWVEGADNEDAYTSIIHPPYIFRDVDLMITVRWGALA